MYINDSNTDITQRLQDNTNNSNYSFKNLEVLDKFLRDINPWVYYFKMMYEVEYAHNKKQKSGTSRSDIRMIYIRESNHDKRRYNFCFLSTPNLGKFFILMSSASFNITNCFSMTFYKISGFYSKFKQASMLSVLPGLNL